MSVSSFTAQEYEIFTSVHVGLCWLLVFKVDWTYMTRKGSLLENVSILGKSLAEKYISTMLDSDGFTGAADGCDAIANANTSQTFRKNKQKYSNNNSDHVLRNGGFAVVATSFTLMRANQLSYSLKRISNVGLWGRVTKTTQTG